MSAPCLPSPCTSQLGSPLGHSTRRAAPHTGTLCQSLGFNGTRHCRPVLMALGFNAAAAIQKISRAITRLLLFLPDGVLERTHKLLHGSFNASELGGL